MKLSHNIDAVQDRLRLLEAELPKALLRALSPDYWIPALAASAMKVLRKEWANEVNLERRAAYERLSPEIVNTITGALYDGGAWFTMTVPHATLDLAAVWPDLARASVYNQSITPTGQPGRPTQDVALAKLGDPALLFTEDQQNLDKVRQTILDWVTTEKRWDTRDYHADGTPYTPQERAVRIEEILGVGPHATGAIRTPAMDEARLLLAGPRGIQGWLDRKGDTQPEAAHATRAALPTPPPEPGFHPGELEAVLGGWLEKVLAAWVIVVRERLPLRIESELRKLRGKLKAK